MKEKKSIKTNRAKTNFVNESIRVGTKLAPGDYQALKLICGCQSWTIEERLAEIILKDIQYNMNTKWFKAYVAKLQFTSMGQVVNIVNGIRNGEIKIDTDEESDDE
mgnify:FL=1